jgi:diguanylate cyclase (GGDEF)-like protein
MARMVRELESHHQRSMRVNRLNDLLQSCRAEAEAHEVIALSASEIFANRPGCLSLVTRGGAELERVACWGGSSCVRPTFVIDDCWALRRGESHEVRRSGELTCGHFEHPPEHGYLCLPLVVRGETLGLLTLEYPSDAGDEEIDDLREQARSVGETIKLSLSNLRLRVALQEQATHDALTGLFNRRYLDDTLPRELHRVERNGGHLAVAMLDIDHFKRFNDQMGHEAGDLVLREIGQLLRNNLRKSDIGCRYGGEELMLILPDSGAEDAHARLADICDQIRAMRIGYRNDVLPPVTVSVGIAATNGHHPNTTLLLRAADDALYAAKAAGRDRIVVSGAATPT